MKPQSKYFLLSAAKFGLFVMIFGVLVAHNPALAVKKQRRVRRKFPHGCRQMGYQIENGLLVMTPADPEKPQSLYFIHNKTNTRVELKIRKLETQQFSPSYANTIYYNRWGAFALDEEKMQFECTADGVQEDCGNVLELCQYNNVKFSTSNQGTYWVAKSESLNQTIRQSVGAGILLRW